MIVLGLFLTGLELSEIICNSSGSYYDFTKILECFAWVKIGRTLTSHAVWCTKRTVSFWVRIFAEHFWERFFVIIANTYSVGGWMTGDGQRLPHCYRDIFSLFSQQSLWRSSCHGEDLECFASGVSSCLAWLDVSKTSKWRRWRRNGWSKDSRRRRSNHERSTTWVFVGQRGCGEVVV